MCGWLMPLVGWYLMCGWLMLLVADVCEYEIICAGI
jgi:hypothetical protein